jgi:hypothetical protein
MRVLGRVREGYDGGKGIGSVFGRGIEVKDRKLSILHVDISFQIESLQVQYITLELKS